MKKRVVFHVGAPKTATTSLQVACVRRRHELRKEGIFYPVFRTPAYPGRRNKLYTEDQQGDVFEHSMISHLPLFWSFQKRLHPTFQEREKLDSNLAEWKSLIKEFRDGPEHTIIISAETVFFQHEDMNLYELLSLFDGMERTLAFGLRHPEELLHSLYATGVLGVERLSIPAQAFHVAKRYMNGGFERIIKSLIDTVQPGEVKPFWMKDLWNNGHTVLGGFFDLIGIPNTIEQEFHSRPTPNEATVLFLRQLTRRKIDDETYRNVVKAVETVIHESKIKRAESFFPEAMQERLSARFAEDVEWLSSGLGMTKPAKVIIPPLPFRRMNTPAENAAIIEKLLPAMTKPTATRMRAMQRHLMQAEGKLATDHGGI
ncbi:hypothetical protein [Neotabrizicola shimadae]|uniref:Sulfotransferase family protein n=1 Tax=Neotabrizicola shimadae TaxID=2807096 RepID=A0A8G0ZYD1_9RHOB|nr:hypothetical protein [Neotabrizicola shimadae]QYZ71347.1 hypothetical protein JO391_07540 [Neotabrizicola shimadae]